MDLGDTRAGNRFDSLTGSFSTIYFASTLEACFGETLARYRADPKLTFIEDEWEQRGFMPRGSVPAEWRQRRTAVRAEFDTSWLFLDIKSAATRAFLQKELAPLLVLFDVDDLDVSSIRGHDRRITRAISQWVWQQQDADSSPLFAGIRYLSRVNTHWECWAVFDDVPLIERERRPILRESEGLRSVATLYDLLVF